jgi:succinate dehydrogenase / fumarate reductase flavoprotein subunit
MNPYKEPKNWRFSVGAWSLDPVGPGGELLNAKGESLYDKYQHMFEPYMRKGKGRIDQLRTGTGKWVIIKTIAMEVKEGRGSEHGGCFVSYKHVPDVKKWMKDQWWKYAALEKIGVDPEKDPVEVGYDVVHTLRGGIMTNERCEVLGVPGLYAAGGCACVGTGMTACVASAQWAAESSMERVKSVETPTLDWSQVEEDEEKINRLLGKTMDKIPDGVFSAVLKNRIKKLMLEKAGYWKNGKDMTELLNELKRIREEDLPKMVLKTDSKNYNKGLVEALEVESLLDCCQMYVEKCLMRKESREFLQRTDYPEADPYWGPYDESTGNTLGNRFVIAKLINDKIEYRTITPDQPKPKWS